MWLNRVPKQAAAASAEQQQMSGCAGSPAPVLNVCPSLVGWRKKPSLTAAVELFFALMGPVCDNSMWNGSFVVSSLSNPPCSC